MTDWISTISALLNAALRAADPAGAVRRHLSRLNDQLIIGPYCFDPGRGRIFLVAVGKAALPMAQAAVEVLGDALAEGIVVTKRPEERPAGAAASADAPRVYTSAVGGGRRVRIFEAGHPLPDQRSVDAANAVQEMLRQTTARDVVLCLISGGASALLSRPLIDLADMQAVTEALLASGCTIQELNTVRWQLDAVKGGGLACWAEPAACASLILSDVVGNPLEVIGSGPTVPQVKRPAEARAVLERYGLQEVLEPAVWQAVSTALDEEARAAGSNDRNGEQQIANMIIGDVRAAAEAVREAAGELGFQAQLLTAHLEGEAREAGRFVAALAQDTPPGSCLVLGGETTVTVRGSGRGGRNQELALAAALGIAGREDVTIVAFATDGEDGPTDAAGAVVDGRTVPEALRLGLDPRAFLENNDSYAFFTALAREGGPPCLLNPGPTGTNVNDLVVILRAPEENGEHSSS